MVRAVKDGELDRVHVPDKPLDVLAQQIVAEAAAEEWDETALFKRYREAYPYRNIHGYLRQIFDAFGPDRCFWGTDITRMPCTYRQCVTMFTEELPWLKGRDLERVMGGAVVDWLGWKRPAET